MFREEKIVKPGDVAGRTKKGRWMEGAQQAGKKITQEMLPSPVADAGELIKRAQGKGDYKGRLESWGSLLADSFAGIKTRPVQWRDQIRSKLYKKDQQAQSLDRQITTLANKRHKAAKRGDTERVKELEEKIQEKAARLQRHAEQYEGEFGESLKTLQNAMEGSD
jgi:gas vesicle protein